MLAPNSTLQQGRYRIIGHLSSVPVSSDSNTTHPSSHFKSPTGSQPSSTTRPMLIGALSGIGGLLVVLLIGFLAFSLGGGPGSAGDQPAEDTIIPDPTEALAVAERSTSTSTATQTATPTATAIVRAHTPSPTLAPSRPLKTAKDLLEAIALAESIFSTINQSVKEYQLIEARQLLAGGQHCSSSRCWQLTFKSANLLPTHAQPVIGAGGELFITVDLDENKATLTGYGE